MADIESVPRIIIAQELEDLKARIIQNHTAAGQVASGKTAKSLRIVVDEESGTLYGRSPFGTLETGRRGGRVPRQFYLIIRQWMKDKGINAPSMPYKTNRPHKYTPAERGARSMAAAIAQVIRRSGTKLYRDGGRDDIYSREIENTRKILMERLSRFIIQKIEHIKLNTNMEIN